MTRIYYYVPEDGDIELQPNVFELSKSIDSVKLKDIKNNFPLTGQYIYRFKRSFKSSYIWVDQLNDSESLPQYNSKIFMKVTRTAGSLTTPRMAPSTPIVESSPRSTPSGNVADVKQSSAPKPQVVPQQPQVQPAQPQPPQQAPSKTAKLSSTGGKQEVKKPPAAVKQEQEVDIDLFSSDFGQKPQSNNGEKSFTDMIDSDGKNVQRGRMNTSELLDIDFTGGSPSFNSQAAPPSNKKNMFNSNSGKGLGDLDPLF